MDFIDPGNRHSSLRLGATAAGQSRQGCNEGEADRSRRNGAKAITSTGAGKEKTMVATVMEHDKSGFLERLASNPSAIVAFLIAVIGQALFSIIFQITNNERQEARISANTTSLSEFRSAVNNLQTPLSMHVFKLEDGIIDVRKSLDDMNKRLDNVDITGTRALTLVTANQQRVMSQLDRLADRIIMQDKNLSEFEIRVKLLEEKFLKNKQ